MIVLFQYFSEPRSYREFVLNIIWFFHFLSLFLQRNHFMTAEMTAVQLNTMNTELWQSIGAIADSEPLMKRLTRYAKKLVKEREADPTLMTKEDFFQMIDEAKKGPSKRFDSIEELDRYISSL